MSDDLEQIAAWIGAIAQQLEPKARRRLTRALGVQARKDQSQRIGAQKNPDGSRYAPRKRPDPIRGRGGKVRQRAEAAKTGPMFRRLRQAGLLKARSDADSASVGFPSNQTSRIARVHQDGKRDKVSRRPGAPEVQYAQRILLGFSDEDKGRLMDLVLAHLQG